MKLDLNTRLEDDEFLYPKGRGDNSSTDNMLNELNERGIYTVGDLINYDLTKFNSEKNTNANFYRAVVQILKYKYLGEELPNNDILQFEYEMNKGFWWTIELIANDLKKLGIGKNRSKIVERLVLCIDFEELDSISMEEILKADTLFKYGDISTYGGVNLRDFYLDYIEKHKHRTIKPKGINKNLEDDEFVNFYGRMDHSIMYLNKRGIYTVKDLINCDQSQLPTGRVQFYQALIQVLKYKYLDEELPNDAILEKKYCINSPSKTGERELKKDLLKLGFSYPEINQHGHLEDYRDESYYRRNEAHIVSMEEFLKSDDLFKRIVKIIRSGGYNGTKVDFRGFYVC